MLSLLSLLLMVRRQWTALRVKRLRGHVPLCLRVVHHLRLARWLIRLVVAHLLLLLHLLIRLRCLLRQILCGFARLQA